jgi:hypothetical protein
MTRSGWIGNSASGAALRGLLLGLVLQALLVGGIAISGPPVDPELVALSAPQPWGPTLARVGR